MAEMLGFCPVISRSSPEKPLYGNPGGIDPWGAARGPPKLAAPFGYGRLRPGGKSRKGLRGHRRDHPSTNFEGARSAHVHSGRARSLQELAKRDDISWR